MSELTDREKLDALGGRVNRAFMVIFSFVRIVQMDTDDPAERCKKYEQLFSEIFDVWCGGEE